MRTIQMLMIPFLLLALSAESCKTTPNPVATADRPETVALALYGGYVSAEEIAADVAENPGTNADVKAALKAADAKASPFVEKLPAMAKQVASIRADVEAGRAAGATDLQTSLAKLNDWITQCAPLIKDFTDTANAAKKNKAATPATPAPAGATTP